MEMIITFGIGVIIGCIIMASIFRIRSIGSLRVDTSDPDDNPYLFLELSKDVSTICEKKYVMLKVNLKNYISHE